MEPHPDFLAKLLGVNDDKVMIQQRHFHKPDDDDDDDKHGNDGGGFAGLTGGCAPRCISRTREKPLSQR